MKVLQFFSVGGIPCRHLRLVVSQKRSRFVINGLHAHSFESEGACYDHKPFRFGGANASSVSPVDRRRQLLLLPSAARWRWVADLRTSPMILQVTRRAQSTAVNHSKSAVCIMKSVSRSRRHQAAARTGRRRDDRRRHGDGRAVTWFARLTDVRRVSLRFPLSVSYSLAIFCSLFNAPCPMNSISPRALGKEGRYDCAIASDV